MAGAPISWGICEVPGWGMQLPVDRVLGEMQEVGLSATELGAAGWLPGSTPEIRARLDRFGLSTVAAFVPLVLHDPAQRAHAMATADAMATQLAALGATNFVTAIVSDLEVWDRPELTESQWQHLYAAVEQVGEIAARHGLAQAVHPHVNTIIEQKSEVQRVLDHTSAGFCLDTGHLIIGGFDPVEFAHRNHKRVTLVHLKDVKFDVMKRHQDGELSLMAAVQQGIFVPLGSGDVALREVVTTLESAGYAGWYVFEQDAALTDGEPPVGSGPISDVRESVAFLRGLAA
jgi:inosose dehydratase